MLNCLFLFFLEFLRKHYQLLIFSFTVLASLLNPESIIIVSWILAQRILWCFARASKKELYREEREGREAGVRRGVRRLE